MKKDITKLTILVNQKEKEFLVDNNTHIYYPEEGETEKGMVKYTETILNSWYSNDMNYTIVTNSVIVALMIRVWLKENNYSLDEITHITAEIDKLTMLDDLLDRLIDWGGSLLK